MGPGYEAVPAMPSRRLSSRFVSAGGATSDGLGASLSYSGIVLIQGRLRQRSEPYAPRESVAKAGSAMVFDRSGHDTAGLCGYAPTRTRNSARLEWSMYMGEVATGRREGSRAKSQRRLEQVQYLMVMMSSASNRPQSPPVRCVCFDFNGTLVDSFSLMLRHYTRLAPKYGCRVPAPEDREHLRGLHAKEVLAQLGVPYRHIPQMALRMREAVHSELMDLEPVPGIREAVRELANAGYRLGVLTSSNRDYLLSYLQKHGIGGIDFVSTSNVLFGKAIALGKVVRRQGISPRELLYVGDELRDLDVARKVGCLFAAVTWGYTAAKTLEVEGVDMLCRSPADLIDGISKIVK